MNHIDDNHKLGKYFKSLPGAGAILACTLLAVFGDNKEYAMATRGQKGKTYSAAVRAVTHEWVNIIYHIWKNEIIYQESKIISSAA